MSDRRAVLVTGANRGIGYEIVKQLCSVFKGDVILTARSEKKGREAVKSLQAEGLDPVFIQLDITSFDSIEAAKKEVVSKYGQLDVLINNAGVCFNTTTCSSVGERAVLNLNANFYGSKNLTEAFLPIMKPNGRIVAMCSESANMYLLVGPQLQKEFSNPDITMKRLIELMEDYLETTKTGNADKLESKGWPSPDADDDSYSIAEVGKIVLFQVFAKQCASDPNNKIDVVSVVPGWVRTEMGSEKAPDPPELGAVSSVLVTLLPPGRSRYHGKMINKEKDFLDWDKMKENYEAYVRETKARNGTAA